MSIPRRLSIDEEEIPAQRTARSLAYLKQRGQPKFFILNRDGELEFWSPNLQGSDLLLKSKRLLARLKSTSEFVMHVDEKLGADTMLRVVPLTGEPDGHVAVFIEDSSRNLLAAASERFALTRREIDVLHYILKGYRNTRIAHSLFISDGTVTDHVKNILRKTGTSSRSELVLRVLDRDVEPTR